ncbi:hypothetical protein GobsT_03560 [Gemmata obscuriglobus]|uniref:Carboxypeptidase regulatory-like domain-containing protein n=1 Tax=Gemmata obscuriglobus TaxID=114 RepID=A0A2Z3H5M7_9BACT|nr:hypothetical protein [Gemmata obscuriglobus]AWM41048.1 hypothetical protein C1280_31385 [Gemmata obscuriglobus]QEG25629.1 hypothetical protein GobsT_03560 [Gemmata obscuriglobus]VTR99157.1 Uncharacterized protein OS=Singulisphaera acidiphila (strain ATCC BAA-1392 / DSM 18658 / VKM B-2454 / MOB10) GN=Sinac_0557 PE=4 SV=1 [Gemmata obscuriglobus UQM 2246]
MRAGVWRAVALAALIGCGDAAPKRGPVRGTVSVDGTPLATGKVRFFALTNGISAEGEVRDGQYEIPVERGPTAGRYRVEIIAEQKTGRRVPDPDAAPGTMRDETVNVIPPKYNRNSALQVDYDPAANAAHDFRLLTK